MSFMQIYMPKIVQTHLLSGLRNLGGQVFEGDGSFHDDLLCFECHRVIIDGTYQS